MKEQSCFVNDPQQKRMKRGTKFQNIKSEKTKGAGEFCSFFDLTKLDFGHPRIRQKRNFALSCRWQQPRAQPSLPHVLISNIYFKTQSSKNLSCFVKLACFFAHLLFRCVRLFYSEIVAGDNQKACTKQHGLLCVVIIFGGVFQEIYFLYICFIVCSNICVRVSSQNSYDTVSSLNEMSCA